MPRSDYLNARHHSSCILQQFCACSKICITICISACYATCSVTSVMNICKYPYINIFTSNQMYFLYTKFVILITLVKLIVNNVLWVSVLYTISICCIKRFFCYLVDNIVNISERTKTYTKTPHVLNRFKWWNESIQSMKWIDSND